MVHNLLPMLGILVTAIGIPILYLQLRDLKASLQSSTHASIYTQAEAIRGYLIQYPELRKYFFDSVSILPSDKEYSRVVSIAEVYLNYLEQIAVLKKSFGKENLDALRIFTLTALEKSPILRQHLKNNANLYSSSLHKMVENKAFLNKENSDTEATHNTIMTMSKYITQSEKMDWKPLLEDGVNTKGIYIKILHFDETTNRAPTFLLKFEAGASYPYHNHPAGEEAYVLEGEAYFNEHKLVKGDFLYTPPTFKHSVKTDTGCVILFKVPEEVEIL
ncbi:MAG: cupin domain-containing protein [Gelidibacter sp.]